MSDSFVKEECGADVTQGTSNSNNANVKIKNEVVKETEMKEEPVQGKDFEINIKKENEINEKLVQNLTDDTSKIVDSNYCKDDSSSSMEDEATKDSSENDSDGEVKITHPRHVRSECESDEDLMDFSYAKDIRKILDVVARPGTFACGGVLEKPMLKLSVKGVGKIKLPLSYKQGEVLKSKCEAAPFGRGTSTLMNKVIRDAWQIDAKDVSLNKDFNKMVKEKVAEIMPTLMGESFTENEHVEFELYKLVYYQKGGHFVTHRDTEKAPGMFATLVIQLPADHTGGALVVRHKSETKVFDFEDDSINNFFFTAFFADCEHELREVTAGHRLVLIYSLIRKSPISTLVPNKDIISYNNQKFITTIRKSVEDWKSDNNGPKYLTLKLDHLYTNTNTSFQNLKGKDKTIADALCSCADIQVYLATLTKEETHWGYSDQDHGCGPDLAPDGEYEETKCFYMLHNWINVNNKTRPFGNLKLHKREMLNEEDTLLKCEERCGSEYDYTGNAGCDVNYFYKMTALVFWPKSHEIMISCFTNFSSELVNCKKLSENNKESGLEKLEGILFYIKKKPKAAMNQLQNNNKVATIFEIMNLFEVDTIKCLANTFLLALSKPLASKYSWCSNENIVGLPNVNGANALANLINKLSWESLGNSVLQVVKGCAVFNTESCTQLVSSLLSLGLHVPAFNVVKVVAPLIIKQSDDSIAQMHCSLQPKEINQYSIKNDFQTFLSILKDNGWKNLSLKSITFLWPVVLFVEKFNQDVSLLHSFVQSINEHENSSKFLKELLKLPNVVEVKDNPSVQLMVQKRLQQLEIPYPVFSWAMPNAKLERGYRSFGTINLENVNNFLRSNEQTKTFRGVFSGVREARYFAEKCENHSTKYEIIGKGKNAGCKIIKTMDYFNAEVRNYNLLHKEAEELKNTFCKFNEIVSRKRARE